MGDQSASVGRLGMVGDIQLGRDVFAERVDVEAGLQEGEDGAESRHFRSVSFRVRRRGDTMCYR